MEISGYTSLLATSQTEETERVRRVRQESDPVAFFSRTGDTATFSGEALRLARESMQRGAATAGEAAEHADKTDLFGASTPPHGATEGAERNGTTQAAQEGGGKAASGKTGDGDGIKKQIEALTARIQAVAGSSLPDTVKQSSINAYQTQIQELQEQLRQEEQAAQQA